MPEGLRVSDQQREQAADALRDHYAAGRLTEDELNERLDAALAAKTEPELDALLADLPKLPVSPRQRKAELVARRNQLQRRVIQEAGGGAGLFVLCTGIWAASGANGQFWPIWVLVVVLIPLLRNSWRLYGPSPELDRVERELEQKAREDDQRRHRERASRRDRERRRL